jgi:hypothetical protein
MNRSHMNREAVIGGVRVAMYHPDVPRLHGHPAPTAMYLADFEDEEGRCLAEQPQRRRLATAAARPKRAPRRSRSPRKRRPPRRKAPSAAPRRNSPRTAGVGARSRLSDAELRALHEEHLGGASINALGARVWSGRYASPKSATNAILRGFVRLGLPRRDRLVASRRALTKHGLWRTAERGSAANLAYRRLHRAAKGQTTLRRCQGRVTRSGRPCRRWAMHGSRFCVSHDPATAPRMAAHIRRERSKYLAATAAARTEGRSHSPARSRSPHRSRAASTHNRRR